MTDTDAETVTNVAFNPIIMAPPNDHNTIYTTMKRMKEVSSILGQTHTPVIFDMGILIKALEIKWSAKDDFAGVILLEGGMHFLMSVFAGIGHLYGDAGLRQLLCDSDVYAAGSIQQILCGKDFDRALMAYKLVDETLHRRFFCQFREWTKQKQGSTDYLEHVDKQTNTVFQAFEEQSSSHSLQQAVLDMNEVIQEYLQPAMKEFREEGRSLSPTFMLWDDFLQKVLLPLKLFICSSRTGDWELNMFAKTSLLPLLFATNRSTYAKYMSYLVLESKQLPSDIAKGFSEGLFVAKLSKGKFNKVWMDYVLETTENKSLKGSGGIIGLTLRDSALARWFLARPVTAKFSMQFAECVCRISNQDLNLTSHHSASKSETDRFNRNVAMMDGMFDGIFVDPFNITEPPTNLVNIATGTVAPANIQESLLNCLDKGELASKIFVEDRFCVPEGKTRPKKSFYDPLPRPNVRTFSELTKSVHIKSRNITMNPEVMYLRLLAVNSLKKVPLERVLSFENAPIPLSLFSEDGVMLSGTKSDFMHKLEGLLTDSSTHFIPDCDCIIFDGHAVIQMLQAPTALRNSFRQMAERFFRHIVLSKQKYRGIKQIHIVFDSYLPNSIKSQTRQKRGEESGNNQVHIRPEAAIPKDWQKFLSVGRNKESLAKFYTEHMLLNAAKELKDNQELYIAGGSETVVYKITANETCEVEELKSNQEEADTRMILHSVFASSCGLKTIVVRSPDTDVLVLLLHYRPSIKASKLYFWTGRCGPNTDETRFVPVYKLYQLLTPQQHQIMLPVYCLTGCDTCSSFYGIGKKTVFKTLMQQADIFQGLSLLGNGPMTKNVRLTCTNFVGHLYGKPGCVSLNQLRCEKARKKVAAKRLPPTENSFSLHLKRCCYQLMIWKRCLEGSPQIPSPTEFGYYIKNETGLLKPEMMTQSPAAPELLNDILCNCESECNDTCTCALNRQACTKACSCEALLPTVDGIKYCSNIQTILAIETGINDSDIEDG